MEQLELRRYPREEIAKVLSLNIKDSRHFKRNLESKLSKMGYGYHYEYEAVEILSLPNDPKKRLAALLIEGCGIDIQVDVVQFACFLSAFIDIDGFESMTWKKREFLCSKYYGTTVCDRTLWNWCSQLIDSGVIAKTGGYTKWRTYFDGNRKIQEPIEEIDEVEMDSYFERRGALFKDHYITALERGLPPKEARDAAWKETYVDLWAEFQCCFYYCKTFTLNAFSESDEVDIREVYELAHELAAAAPPPIEASTAAPQSSNVFVF